RIIVVPAVAQVTVEGRSFDAGRTFLLPRACNALNEVFAFAMRMQAKHSVVVAHVDEAEPAPDALSEARAKLAAAWLRARRKITRAFGRRCIAASGVARRSNTPVCSTPRALLASRIGALDAPVYFAAGP